MLQKIYNHIFLPSANKKSIADNQLISTPNQYQRGPPKPLSEDKHTEKVFALGKEERVKRYSLYDKWTKKEDTEVSSTLDGDRFEQKTDYDKKEIKKEDNKLSWEIKNLAAVNLTKGINPAGSVEVGDEQKGSLTDVNTNLQGKCKFSPS